MRPQQRGPRERRPDGFTLIEILVVVFIVAIIMALLLPAVMSAREASRRVQCSNNLKQFGIAIANYVSRVGVLPQGTMGSSIHYHILPDIEQRPLYQSMNYDSHSLRRMADNATAMRTRVDVFLCPSDTPGAFARASVNYAGNLGTGYGDGFNGAFAGTGVPPISLSSISDGTSNTVAMSEWLFGPLPKIVDPKRTTFATISQFKSKTDFPSFVRDCNSDSATSPNGGKGKGTDWTNGSLLMSMYNHVNTVNGRSCTNRGLVQQGAWTAGSAHFGGCNSLFLDGHVQFVKQSISLHVWKALGTRNAGDVASNE